MGAPLWLVGWWGGYLGVAKPSWPPPSLSHSHFVPKGELVQAALWHVHPSILSWCFSFSAGWLHSSLPQSFFPSSLLISLLPVSFIGLFWLSGEGSLCFCLLHAHSKWSGLFFCRTASKCHSFAGLRPSQMISSVSMTFFLHNKSDVCKIKAQLQFVFVQWCEKHWNYFSPWLFAKKYSSVQFYFSFFISQLIGYQCDPIHHVHWHINVKKLFRDTVTYLVWIHLKNQLMSQNLWAIFKIFLKLFLTYLGFAKCQELWNCSLWLTCIWSIACMNIFGFAYISLECYVFYHILSVMNERRLSGEYSAAEI